MGCVQIKWNSLHDSSIHVRFCFPIKDAKQPKKLSTFTNSGAKTDTRNTQEHNTTTYQGITQQSQLRTWISSQVVQVKSKITTKQVAWNAIFCECCGLKPQLAQVQRVQFPKHWRFLSRQPCLVSYPLPSISWIAEASWLRHNHITTWMKKHEIYCPKNPWDVMGCQNSKPPVLRSQGCHYEGLVFS